jgi:hypothetical protein
MTQSLLLPRREDPQVRTPFENRPAQNRTTTTRAQTIASHSMYGASPTIHAPAPSFCVQLGFVKKNWDNCRAARRELLKNSSGVVFRSQNDRQRAAPERYQASPAFAEFPPFHRAQPAMSWKLKTSCGECSSYPQRRRQVQSAFRVHRRFPVPSPVLDCRV